MQSVSKTPYVAYVRRRFDSPRPQLASLSTRSDRGPPVQRASPHERGSCASASDRPTPCPVRFCVRPTVTRTARRSCSLSPRTSARPRIPCTRRRGHRRCFVRAGRGAQGSRGETGLASASRETAGPCVCGGAGAGVLASRTARIGGQADVSAGMGRSERRGGRAPGGGGGRAPAGLRAWTGRSVRAGLEA